MYCGFKEALQYQWLHAKIHSLISSDEALQKQLASKMIHVKTLDLKYGNDVITAALYYLKTRMNIDIITRHTVRQVFQSGFVSRQ